MASRRARQQAPIADDDFEQTSESELLAGWKQHPVVGLENLGNTCFMNCTLQQLLHVQPLVSYFLQDDIVNRVNKRSCRDGVLCGSFATLCRDVIKAANSSTKSIAPVKFKKAVAQYAPYLLDYQQQDCHEFMRFLLDGLSEDLCRSELPERKPPAATPAKTESLSEGNSPSLSVKATSPAKKGLSERLRERVSGARTTYSDVPVLTSNKSAPPAIGKQSSPAASFKGVNPFSISGKTDDTSVGEADEEGRGEGSELDTIASGAIAQIEIDNKNMGGTTESGLTTTAITSAETETEGGRETPAAEAATPAPEKEKEKELSLSPQQAAYKAWQGYMKLNDSVVSDLFAGMLQSTLECQTCKNTTHSFEPFLDISVSIPRAESKSMLQKTLLATGSGGGEGSRISLDTCFSQYTASEKVCEHSHSTAPWLRADDPRASRSIVSFGGYINPEGVN